MSDPNNSNRGISVTLKQDGRDGSWLVFHGSPAAVREDVMEMFSLDPDAYGEYTIHDLVCEAQRMHKGISNAGTILGARPIKDDPPFEPSDKPAKAEGGKPEENPLLALIADAQSVDDLKALYKRNAAEFKGDKGLMAAWKSRGKELQG